MTFYALFALARRYWREVALGLLAALAFAAVLQWRAGLIERGRVQAELARWKADAAALRHAALHQDTVIAYRVDTLERIRVRRDRFPLPAIPDTVRDTVTVTTTAGAVRACEAEATACELVRQGLEQRLETERQRRVLDSTRWAGLAPPRPHSPWPKILLGVGLGFAVGQRLR